MLVVVFFLFGMCVCVCFEAPHFFVFFVWKRHEYEASYFLVSWQRCRWTSYFVKIHPGHQTYSNQIYQIWFQHKQWNIPQKFSWLTKLLWIDALINPYFPKKGLTLDHHLDQHVTYGPLWSLKQKRNLLLKQKIAKLTLKTPEIYPTKQQAMDGGHCFSPPLFYTAVSSRNSPYETSQVAVIRTSFTSS